MTVPRMNQLSPRKTCSNVNNKNNSNNTYIYTRFIKFNNTVHRHNEPIQNPNNQTKQKTK